MGISTKHTQKTAKPRIMQLSLKSGKYQLLCFLKISSVAHCGFVPSIFLLVQIKLNMRETQTNSHACMDGHTGKLLDSEASCTAVIYNTLTHTHIHGEPLPNPSPQTGVQQSESYVPPLTAILIIVGWLQPQRCLAQEPPGAQPHRWLAGLLPKQKTDLKASICMGVTCLCKTLHTNTHIGVDNSPGHMKAGDSGLRARQHYLETKEQHLCGGEEESQCSCGIQHVDGSCLQGGKEDGACACLLVHRWIYLRPQAMCAPSVLQLRSL